MAFEYKTVICDGQPTPLVNAEAARGWEFFMVTAGAWRGGSDDRWLNPPVQTLWFRRDYKAPEPDPPVRAKKAAAKR